MTLNKDQRLGIKIVLGFAILFLGFGAFQYPTVRSRRQAIETKHQMWQIFSSLEEFRNKKGRFPSVNEFDRQFGSMRDAWGAAFRYSPSPTKDPQTYRLGSAGHDSIWQHSDLRDYEINIRLFEAVKNADIIMSEEGLIQGPNFE